MADKSKNNTAASWLPGASDKIGFGMNIFGDFVNPKLKDKVPADVQLKIKDLAADIKARRPNGPKVPKDKF